MMLRDWALVSIGLSTAILLASACSSSSGDDDDSIIPYDGGADVIFHPGDSSTDASTGNDSAIPDVDGGPCELSSGSYHVGNVIDPKSDPSCETIADGGIATFPDDGGLDLVASAITTFKTQCTGTESTTTTHATDSCTVTNVCTTATSNLSDVITVPTAGTSATKVDDLSFTLSDGGPFDCTVNVTYTKE